MTAHAMSPLPRPPTLAGQPAFLDPSGALWLPDAEVLVVSDLHFEKGSHFAQRGQFLPPYDTRATLGALERLVAVWRPRRIVSLGDAFHDPQAERRMDEEDAARLEALCRAAEWLWVLGNHDPHPPQRFAGSAGEVIEAAGLVFVHEPGDHPGWNAAGHLHPCAVATRDGRGVRRRAFVTDGVRMILPAFGAFTGGLNVLDEAFAGLLEEPFTAHLCGRDRVYAVPRHCLRTDALPPAWRL